MHFSRMKHKVQKLRISLSLGHTLRSALGQTAIDFSIFFQKYSTVFKIIFFARVSQIAFLENFWKSYLGVQL